MAALPGTERSRSVQISADGETVTGHTGVTPTGGPNLAYRWSEATGTVPIPHHPLATFMSVADVAADGSRVVGQWSNGGSHALLWDAELGTVDLQELPTNPGAGPDLVGWELQRASGISGDGRTLVGWGTNPAGQREGWRVVLPAILPEPGTALLVGLGLGALGFRARS